MSNAVTIELSPETLKIVDARRRNLTREEFIAKAIDGFLRAELQEKLEPYLERLREEERLRDVNDPKRWLLEFLDLWRP